MKVHEILNEIVSCKVCNKPATKRLIWADGRGFVPSCDAHESDIKALMKKRNTPIEKVETITENEMKVSEILEAAPSAGLSKKEKSAVAKKAKAGKDIGKKGKNFKKVAAKAAKKYGSKEAGEKVAAAAMWKNVKR